MFLDLTNTKPRATPRAEQKIHFWLFAQFGKKSMIFLLFGKIFWLNSRIFSGNML